MSQHQKICSTELRLTSKQKSYGGNQSDLDILCDQGHLPESFRNFRQTLVAVYDIETLEEPCEDFAGDSTVKEASHRLASIAVASNVPDVEDVCFLRSSSDKSAELELIKKFVKHLLHLQTAAENVMPTEIADTIEYLEEEIAFESFGKGKLARQNQLRTLKKFRQLPCLGFNSGQYIPTITSSIPGCKFRSRDFIIFYFRWSDVFFSSFRPSSYHFTSDNGFARRNWRNTNGIEARRQLLHNRYKQPSVP